MSNITLTESDMEDNSWIDEYNAYYQSQQKNYKVTKQDSGRLLSQLRNRSNDFLKMRRGAL